MPELPEVETIVRDLQEILPGATIKDLQVLRPNVIRGSKTIFKEQLIGKTFDSISRRGKNIVANMGSRLILVVNLGMTGRLGLQQDDSLFTHPAIYFTLNIGPTLVYDDVRRFGKLDIYNEQEWLDRSAQLGPEPLSPDYKHTDLHEKLNSSLSPIRSWLLDQKNVVGVGNIYANESLHLSGIHPQRPANRITEKESQLLYKALRKILLSAIQNRGTTLRNYRDVSGKGGNNSTKLRIYGRHGENCLGCSEPVQRIVFSNRSAFFCPSCQR
ncbi:MAG: bifunctional DNA-formamidopyrimidine glycosylase/DNA-(apurinic or apyrimidinic site) lyase [Longimicrobiales bacterium]